jgi:hypothetical protein
MRCCCVVLRLGNRRIGDGPNIDTIKYIIGCGFGYNTLCVGNRINNGTVNGAINNSIICSSDRADQQGSDHAH